jgi:ABC-type lipoprotein release transport system permease subunit
MSIRHLLPSLQQRIFWEKGKRTAILIGTRGEVPLLHRDQKEPMLVAVPPGSVVVGHELHKSQGLSVGDRIRILNQNFIITKCNEERGNKDDITLWIDLKQAQKLLQRPDQINAILALKCHCAGNEIAKIRTEIAAILPGTQVLEEVSKVLTRAEARDRAAQEAEQSLRAEKEHRRQMRKEQERFAAIVVPAVIGFSMLWIALMFLMNVRERRSEIGVLRAVGLSKPKILSLFLLKALFMGIAGSLIGILLISIFYLVRYNELIDLIHLNWQTILLVIILAPIISVLASWLPAFMASQQDPAMVLSEEA